MIADLEAIDFEPLPDRVPDRRIIDGQRGARPAPGAHRELQPRDRARLSRLPAPLRVPQPRLRRLPGLLRLLQGGVPGDLRPGHRQDGAGHRRRPASGPTTSSSGSPSSRVELDVDERAGDRATSTTRSPRWPPSRAARSGSPPGRPRRTRGSTSPRAAACTATTRSGSTTSRSRSASCATTSRACRRGTTSTGRPRAVARRARPHHRRVPRAAARRRARAPRSTRSSGCADGVPVRREPQLLHRALVDVAVLAQDPPSSAQVLADAGFWDEADDIFYAAPRRDPGARSSTTATAGRWASSPPARPLAGARSSGARGSSRRWPQGAAAGA